MIQAKWKGRPRIKMLVKQLGDMHNAETSIGYFEEQGNHPESTHLNYPTLMAMHELRETTDPQHRPVFKIALDRGGKQFERSANDRVKAVIDAAAMNRRKAPSTLMMDVGNDGIKMIKPIFGSSLLKPNTPATAARKGGNNPLIEFGALKEALAIKTSFRKSIKTFN